ncbi:MFS general substrate transporter [Tuber magnatum]|uniref:MFS general substrate transporter n=1 Tax=Tuber magnatum TaxID=42249 RepID=A0A317SDB9_9PEZI|nr:MFS general substrate transporter [Tuber magnatum]PWW80316.1 MFS general substrate transporter [Tuber magnatum]
MPRRWSLGVLEDPDTEEVPVGTVLLLSSTRQEPLGFETVKSEEKRTPDGKIILNPQPDDHPDDPLNWATWRRDAALLSLGWHCLVGGGQTPVLAAGFNDVAKTFGVTIPEVALTTGLYMMGMGIGCLICSPTAIIIGKRPVYLFGVVLFLGASIWCAASQSYGSLVAGRIVMGIGVAPCEALPSATIAEIFFLHERAYRVGMYTLLLLGGKNLVPLVSAAIIQALDWRWVFWIVAIIVGFNLFLLFVFVPETFWDRTPRPSTRPSVLRRVSSSLFSRTQSGSKTNGSKSRSRRTSPDAGKATGENITNPVPENGSPAADVDAVKPTNARRARFGQAESEKLGPKNSEHSSTAGEIYRLNTEKSSRASLDEYVRNARLSHPMENEAANEPMEPVQSVIPLHPKPFVQTLKIYNGVLRHESWAKAAVRPIILFAYPAILWSTVVYSFSVGWLIVLSETVAHIYQEHPYNFSRLATGLVYISPFIGGIIGTAVAGKISDIIVRAMSRRNGGVYEPEFRLVMGIPVAITTAIGLMGFGWSAEERDNWIVPTVFFGLISFGCSLGSTTAITFCVDSYRQYAGEALVTLNFSKNVFHGLVFSLFFNRWLEKDGSKTVFIALGALQIGALIFTIPLYIYGKRLRLWTHKRALMRAWT